MTSVRLEHRVQVVAHRGHRPPLERGRQQRGRGDQGHLGAEGGVGGDLRAGHAAVADVAHDGHPQAAEGVGALVAPAEGLAHRVEVEQGLGGVLVPSVAGVDHGAVVDPPGHPGRHPGRAVAHDHRVHADGLDGLDGVPQRLALLDRRGAGGEGEDVGRHALGRRLEGHAGAGRVLEEQGGHRAAPQGRHLGIGPAADLGEGVGDAEDVGDRGGVEVVHAQQVGRERAHRLTSSPSDTPSSETSTISSRLVGRFLPT